jgi:hypothetical protein
MIFKYVKESLQSLEKLPRFKFQQIDNEKESLLDDPLTIEATAHGIKIYGRMVGELENKKDLDSFAMAIGEAYIEHSKLKKQLRDMLMAKR